MIHSDFSRRMWRRLSGELLNVEICSSLQLWIIRNVKLLASHCFFYYFQHSHFEHTSVFANLLTVCLSEFVLSALSMIFTQKCCVLYYYVHSQCTFFGLFINFYTRLPQNLLFLKINDQFEPDINCLIRYQSCERRVHNFTIRRVVLFFNCNLQQNKKHDCRRFSIY